jgi:hypothetical protein
MKHTESQRLQVLRYLAQGNTLTVAEALHKFGCYALSQRCGELRKAGWPVESQMIETETGKRIAQYSIKAAQ